MVHGLAALKSRVSGLRIHFKSSGQRPTLSAKRNECLADRSELLKRRGHRPEGAIGGGGQQLTMLGANLAYPMRSFTTSSKTLPNITFHSAMGKSTFLRVGEGGESSLPSILGAIWVCS